MTGYLAAATAGVDAGLTRARELQVRVAVVVLDQAMAVTTVQRMDGAYPSTVDVARAKAHTALNFGAPTSALAERVVPANQAALQAVVPQLMFVPGGVPIRLDGNVVGSVGVSGATADQDRECAEAAAARLSAVLAG
jgi:uncharacterized protein GlcG (DUF336 family)